MTKIYNIWADTDFGPDGHGEWGCHTFEIQAKNEAKAIAKAKDELLSWCEPGTVVTSIKVMSWRPVEA